MSSFVILSCNANQLESLDLSENTALENLTCYNNKLTKLDVKSNTKLESISCYSNQLTSLDISNITGLSGFSCSGNTYNIAVNGSYCLDNLPTGFKPAKA